MLDTHRLARIVYTDSKGQAHKLNEEFSKKDGPFCDANGFVSGPKIRRLYMMAGLISPADDNAETLFHSISSNTMLLNEFYILHYGTTVAKATKPKPVLPSKTLKEKTSLVKPKSVKALPALKTAIKPTKAESVEPKKLNK